MRSWIAELKMRTKNPASTYNYPRQVASLLTGKSYIHSPTSRLSPFDLINDFNYLILIDGCFASGISRACAIRENFLHTIGTLGTESNERALFVFSDWLYIVRECGAACTTGEAVFRGKTIHQGGPRLVIRCYCLCMRSTGTCVFDWRLYRVCEQVFALRLCVSVGKVLAS